MTEGSEGFIKKAGKAAMRIGAVVGIGVGGARAIQSESPTQPIKDVATAARDIKDVISPAHTSHDKLVAREEKSEFAEELDALFAQLGDGRVPDWSKKNIEIRSFTSTGDSYYFTKTNDGRSYVQIRENPLNKPDGGKVTNYRVEKGAVKELSGSELPAENAGANTTYIPDKTPSSEPNPNYIPAVNPPIVQPTGPEPFAPVKGEPNKNYIPAVNPPIVRPTGTRSVAPNEGLTNPPLDFHVSGEILDKSAVEALSKQLEEAFKNRAIDTKTGQTIPSPYPAVTYSSTK